MLRKCYNSVTVRKDANRNTAKYQQNWRGVQGAFFLGCRFLLLCNGFAFSLYASSSNYHGWRLFDVFCLHFFFKVFSGSWVREQGNRVGLRFSEGIFAQSFLAEEEAVIFVFSEELAFYSGGESPISSGGAES